MTIDFKIRDGKKLPDLKVIQPSSFSESRGVIWTSYQAKKIDDLLPNGLMFKHDKFSISKRNVLRGIHGDNKSWKLVSCVAGKIYQVVVDLRENSDTYLKYEAFNLGSQNIQSILIPPGFGNAFYVETNQATYHYKLAYPGDYTDADDQFTVSWDDPRLKIKWPTIAPILSDRDRRL